jgi:hypothetical protein
MNIITDGSLADLDKEELAFHYVKLTLSGAKITNSERVYQTLLDRYGINETTKALQAARSVAILLSNR